MTASPAAILTDARNRAAAAVLAETGAVVELTPGRAGFWCVSGAAGDVKRARSVMRKAGLQLIRTEDDAADYPGESFDFYRAAA